MATPEQWHSLASRINNVKTNRNSAKGYSGTSVGNASTSGENIEAIMNSISLLIVDIDGKDGTKYALTPRGELSELLYYPTADLQIKILEKKLFLNPWCSSYTTCKPYTITNCNPNIYNCGSTCGCHEQCSHSCSCQNVCVVRVECTCNKDGPHVFEETVCCVGDCYYSCCQSDCTSDSCCESDCGSYKTCPSNCTANTPCPSNCGCHNVCGCVFV